MGPSATLMSLSARASYLSVLGDKTEEKSERVEMWKVLQDLWDPKENPNGIVSLGMAENWLMRTSISQHIRNNFNPPDRAFTYGDGTTGSKLLKNAASKFIDYRFNPFKEVLPEHLSMTNGTSSTLEHLSWTLANPGEAFILGQPYYGNYDPDFTWRFGASLLKIPFDNDDDRFSDVAVKKYEDALKTCQDKGPKVAGIVICNPHNPLGRCYPREVIISIMKLCQKYDVHFISDEIYALSTWQNTVDKEPPPVQFESALSINPEGIIDGHRIHVIWGMSKDFGANGLRLGVLISQYNDSLHKALIAVGLYTSISSLTDHVTVKMLEDEEWLDSYIPENQRRLSDAFRKVARWAQNNGITYAKGVNAGFFLWVDLGTKYREKHKDVPEKDVEELVLNALRNKKVFLASGKDFGAEKPGWFRIIFSVADYYLFEGLKRIIEAMN